MSLLKKDAPQQALGLMAAAGSFAAVSTIFGSPVIGAVLIIEATGLGGAALPLVLLPGLLAAGIGSLVFIGLGSWTGFSTSAWQLSPFALPPFDGPGWGDFAWTILLAIAAAVATFAIVELGRWSKRLVDTRPFALTIAAGLVVGRARDRVRRDHRPVHRGGAVLGAGGVRHALRRGRDALRLDPAAALPVQGARVEHLARELPRRADVPRDLPRRGRRACSPRTCPATPRRRRSRCWSGRCACRSCGCRCRP